MVSPSTLNTNEPVLCPDAIVIVYPFGQHTSACAGLGAEHDVAGVTFPFPVNVLANAEFCDRRFTVTTRPSVGAGDGNVTDNVTSVRPALPSRTCAGANDTPITLLDMPGVPDSKPVCGPGPFAFTARIFT